MSFQPQLLMSALQDLLLQSRIQKIGRQVLETKQSFNYGFSLIKPYFIKNHQTIQLNWSQSINEMIILFFVLRKSDGQSFLAEEWNIRIMTSKSQLQSQFQSKINALQQKQQAIFIRSILVLMSLSSLVTEFISLNTNNQFQITHEFFFNAKDQQKRGDWIQPEHLNILEISSNIGENNYVVVNLGFQRKLSSILAQQKPVQKIVKRERFLSDGTIGTELCNDIFNFNQITDLERARTSSDMGKSQRNIAMGRSRINLSGESDSSMSSKNLCVSLFSKKDDVEILQTPDGADRLMAVSIDEYEIQMIIFEESSENRFDQSQEKLTDRVFKEHFKESKEKQQKRQQLLKQVQESYKVFRRSPRYQAQMNYIIRFIKDQ